MLSAIEKARSSIFFEMYIFEDDTSDTHDFIEVLERKAAEGVKVKIVFDDFGSNVSTVSVKKLKEAGAEVFFFKTLFRSTHRKILIVDERIAFVGGVNVKRFFKKWDDLLIRMEGRILPYVLRSFARMYKSRGGKDEVVLRHDREEKGVKMSKGKVWFFEHFPPRNSFRLHKYYRDKIENAREKIMIASPYLMPNRWLIRALKKARKRGVEVEFLVPRFATNPKVTNIPNYFYMHKLHKHGIKFFLTKEMNHAKLMLVDGREGIVGSQNLDILSFDFDQESGVFFTDPNLVKEVSEIVEGWKKGAVLYHPNMRSVPYFDHFLDFCFSFFEYAVKAFNRLTKAL